MKICRRPILCAVIFALITAACIAAVPAAAYSLYTDAGEYVWVAGNPDTECSDFGTIGPDLYNDACCRAAIDEYLTCYDSCLLNLAGDERYAASSEPYLCVGTCMQQCDPSGALASLSYADCRCRDTPAATASPPPPPPTTAVPSTPTDVCTLCGSTESEAEGPDRYSCLDFGVIPSEFDLTYDQNMLREEFLLFLKRYGEKNTLKSASEKYAGWDPANFAKLGYHMFTTNIEETDTTFYGTPQQDALLKERIEARYRAVGRPLTPSEVFGEALAVNDNNVFDSLLCCHNYLKRQTQSARFNALPVRMERQQTLKNVIAGYETTLRNGGYLDADGTLQVDGAPEDIRNIVARRQQYTAELHELQQPSETFTWLQTVRATDNEGAWYHLFGTLTTGYAERENTWSLFDSSAYTRLELFGEHRVYKGFIEGLRETGRKEIDSVEYCWDVWGGYLGGEMYSFLNENREKIIRRINNEPAPWRPLDWEPRYVQKGFAGQKIYE